jgi:hypothetical protein
MPQCADQTPGEAAFEQRSEGASIDAPVMRHSTDNETDDLSVRALEQSNRKTKCENEPLSECRGFNNLPNVDVHFLRHDSYRRALFIQVVSTATSSSGACTASYSNSQS